MTTRKKLAIAAALILIALGTAYGLLFWPQSLPGDIESALASGTDFKLLSIDPNEIDKDGNTIPPPKPDEPQAAGWRILGEKAIAAEQERKQILDEIRSSVWHGDKFRSRACFEPRHDLQFKSGGKTYDILICYHCRNLAIVVNGIASDQLIHIDGSPEKFNAILKAANVPLPKQSHE